MADIKFRALYPKDNNVHAGGLALLADGTLVMFKMEGSGDAAVFFVQPLKIDDKRQPKASWNDKTV
jgi:hypothetical protein